MISDELTDNIKKFQKKITTLFYLLILKKHLMILVLQQFLSHAFMLPMKNFLQQKMALWQKKI
jgi:hypothetical protein